MTCVPTSSGCASTARVMSDEQIVKLTHLIEVLLLEVEDDSEAE